MSESFEKMEELGIKRVIIFFKTNYENKFRGCAELISDYIEEQ